MSLEGFGIPAEVADDAPRKIAKWLDAIANPPRFKPYDDLAAVADRLQKKNPRLPRDKAEFLARRWARALPDGRAELNSDPRHKMPFPHVYRMEESIAIWRSVDSARAVGGGDANPKFRAGSSAIRKAKSAATASPACAAVSRTYATGDW